MANVKLASSIMTGVEHQPMQIFGWLHFRKLTMDLPVAGRMRSPLGDTMYLKHTNTMYCMSARLMLGNSNVLLVNVTLRTHVTRSVIKVVMKGEPSTSSTQNNLRYVRRIPGLRS